MGLIFSEITVRVSLDSFVVTRGEKTLSIATLIYISSDHKRILHFGDDFVPHDNRHIKVELFKNDPHPGIDKFQCLEALLRYAFTAIGLQKSLIRPKVIFKDSSRLENLLCGFQNFILEQSALNSGARECIFE